MSALSKFRTISRGREPGGVAVDGGVGTAGDAWPEGAPGAWARVEEANAALGGGTQPTRSARRIAVGKALDVPTVTLYHTIGARVDTSSACGSRPGWKPLESVS